jgi:hypothetical protein
VILPIEVDEAVDALRVARDTLGVAVDSLYELHAPTTLVDAFTQAMEATSWSIERLSVVGRARDMLDDEAVEERHVEGQTFPWAEDES